MTLPSILPSRDRKSTLCAEGMFIILLYTARLENAYRPCEGVNITREQKG